MRSSQLFACSDSVPGRDVHAPQIPACKWFAPGIALLGRSVRFLHTHTWGKLRAGKWAMTRGRERTRKPETREKALSLEQMQPEPRLQVPVRPECGGTGT